MKHQLRITCFARVQIGAEPISQRFAVEALAKFTYRLHVVRIAPDPHFCQDKTDVIRPLTFQSSGTIQICAGLTSATYLREHNCESVLRTRQIVPGTAWMVEVLQVTNRYVREGSKSAVQPVLCPSGFNRTRETLDSEYLISQWSSCALIKEVAQMLLEE
jgi:hypothetical protein